MNDMTCREVSEFLLAYRDDELEAAQRQEFEAHLALCPDCVQYLRAYEQTVDLGRAAFETSDDSVPEGLVRAIVAARAKRS